MCISLFFSVISILFLIFCIIYYKKTGSYYVLPIFDNPVDLRDKEVIILFIIFIFPVINLIAYSLFFVVIIFYIFNLIADICIKLLNKIL